MIIYALKDGIRRVNRAPLVLAAILVLTFLVALAPGIVLGQMLADSLGMSGASQAAVSRVDYGWWQEFSAGASGVGTSFTPTIIGFAAVLDNLASFADNRGHAAVVAATGCAYVLLWMFLAGGTLDRFARDRRTRSAGFFAACGIFFFRFLRLGIGAALAYVFLFAFVHPWLFDGAYRSLTKEMTIEWHAFAVRVLLYALFVAAVCAVNILFDYAKVRAVVEDRRSMIGALGAAARFVRRRPGAVPLYLLDGCLFAIAIALYAAIAPGGRAPLWWVLLAGQAYLLARLWVKLVFWASEVAFFQQAFAHSAYVAAPPPSWPDSPSAETIVRAAPIPDP